MLLRWPRPKQSPAAERLSRWFLWPHESAVSSPLLCTRRVPRVLSTPYPQVKRVVGNERDAQSKQSGVLRKAAGTDEHGRDLPVKVTDARGRERTLGPDWHTLEQAGRTSESVTPAPTSTRSTHTQHARSAAHCARTYACTTVSNTLHTLPLTRMLTRTHTC